MSEIAPPTFRICENADPLLAEVNDIRAEGYTLGQRIYQLEGRAIAVILRLMEREGSGLSDWLKRHDIALGWPDRDGDEAFACRNAVRGLFAHMSEGLSAPKLTEITAVALLAQSTQVEPDEVVGWLKEGRGTGPIYRAHAKRQKNPRGSSAEPAAFGNASTRRSAGEALGSAERGEAAGSASEPVVDDASAAEATDSAAPDENNWWAWIFDPNGEIAWHATGPFDNDDDGYNELPEGARELWEKQHEGDWPEDSNQGALEELEALGYTWKVFHPGEPSGGAGKMPPSAAPTPDEKPLEADPAHRDNSQRCFGATARSAATAEAQNKIDQMIDAGTLTSGAAGGSPAGGAPPSSSPVLKVVGGISKAAGTFARAIGKIDRKAEAETEQEEDDDGSFDYVLDDTPDTDDPDFRPIELVGRWSEQTSAAYDPTDKRAASWDVVVWDYAAGHFETGEWVSHPDSFVYEDSLESAQQFFIHLCDEWEQRQARKDKFTRDGDRMQRYAHWQRWELIAELGEVKIELFEANKKLTEAIVPPPPVVVRPDHDGIIAANKMLDDMARERDAANFELHALRLQYGLITPDKPEERATHPQDDLTVAASPPQGALHIKRQFAQE